MVGLMSFIPNNLRPRGNHRYFRHARPLAQPVTIFGIAFICLLWFSVFQLISGQRVALEQGSEKDTANIALVIGQSIQRTSSELDLILKFLRQSYESNGFSANWPKLVKEDFTVDDQAVQIAIIDKHGMMVTSSAMLYPPHPVDLSDREHFLVQARSRSDRLFISKPVLGRASGRWSVQFTRKFTQADGSFAGVIVISLDPVQLEKGYSNLEGGTGKGVAVVGADGIIRAGSGIYSGAMGSLYRNPAPGVGSVSKGTVISFGDANGGAQVSASRDVTGYPLKVVVTSNNSAKMLNWRRTEIGYFGGAGVFSLFVLFAMLTSAHRRHRFETEIIHLAKHDSLTGLPNRLQMGEMIESSFLQRPAGSFALHVIDLDGFKTINDTYGHPVGDSLLILVAQRLRANLRASDIVARLGGDEFAIIQCDKNCATSAGRLAARLCEALAQPFQVDALTLNIRASIGIAIGPKDACTTVDLLRVADLALYDSKDAGRGTYRFFSKEMNEKVMARRNLETGLAKAVLKNELVLFYQPIVSLAENEVTGYEALLRWRHPERGLILPLEFVPLAEETGLIVPIGEWVLDQACVDLAACPDHLSLSVNCSPVQLKSDNLVPAVRQALQKSGLSGRRLRIELTESSLIPNDVATVVKIAELRALGIRMSIDDFGTGYSSLAYLQHYPIDCIKIDRSFVSTMTQEQNDKSIIRAIVALASGLRITTVAEGVETASQLKDLEAMGCTEAQGYFFSPPRPASEILPMRNRILSAA